MYDFKEIYTIAFTKVEHYDNDEYVNEIRIDIIIGDNRFSLT